MSMISSNSTSSPDALSIRPQSGSINSFKLMQAMSKVLSSSTMVPVQFRANEGNCFIACELSVRMNLTPIQVMQNLYIVNGRPGWSSQFMIAIWNGSGKFSPIRFEWSNLGTPDVGCTAVSTEYSTGKEIRGATITKKMADAEGWTKKAGSKWATMPEQMFMYRAASFLVRAYAPELALGLHTREELEDVTGHQATQVESAIDYTNITANAGAADVTGETDAFQDEARQEEILEAEVEAMMDHAAAGTAAGKTEGAGTAAWTSVETSVEAEVSASKESTSAETVPEGLEANTDAHQPAVVKESQPSVASESSQTNLQDGTSQVSRLTLTRISELLKFVQPPKEVWTKAIANFGVDKASLLNEQDAQRLVKWLEKKKATIEIKQWGDQALQAREATPQTQSAGFQHSGTA